MTAELQWLGVAESARLIRRRELGPLELVEAILAWIERTDELTRAWVHVAAGEARAEARAAERALAAGEDRGPLHGLVYSVKDVIAVAGMPMRCNSRITADFVPREDAVAIGQLREAGAICLGKVTTHELSTGSVCPPARNPWDGEVVVGGSSGGSGCAVAAGQGPFSVGADCGGSIRIPAALNGACGLRPTLGRVSVEGAVPLSMSLDTVGPLARSAEDVALVLNAIGGDDFTTTLGENVAGLCVGVPRTHFFEHLEEGVRRAVEDGIATLAGLGMEVREVELPHVRQAGAACSVITLAEAAAMLDEYPLDEFGPEVRYFAELGSLVVAKDYLRAQQLRTLIAQDFDDAFAAGVDVLVAPVVAATAKRVKASVEYPDGFSEEAPRAYARLTMPVSVSGCPSLVVPCGFGDDGLPTGMQIVARRFDERTALRVGHAYQQATDWHTRRPTPLVRRAREELEHTL